MEIKQINFNELAPLIDQMLNQDILEKLGKTVKPPSKIAFSLQENGEIVGGITGTLSMENLHINGLVVDKSFQGQDYGTKLMQKMENAASQLGAKILTVSTQNFQALEFYQKMGYEIFGTLEDTPFQGAIKYYLKKKV